MLLGLFLFACDETTTPNDTSDGDIQPDGDVSDGDIPDGDLPDGDKDFEKDSGVLDGDAADGDTDLACLDGDASDSETSDGDPVDGDATDGDDPDGDISDGDTGDGDLDGPDGDVPDGDSDGAVVDGDIVDGDGLHCPQNMALVNGSFCMDRWEASRPDATAEAIGTEDGAAQSVPGVMPWYARSLSMQTAANACQLAGKRLCRSDEWTRACAGPSDFGYVYGNAYSADTCNGIDAFCNCDSGSCAAAEVCPYPHCRSTCGATYHAVPTGTFTACVNGEQIHDLNGNVWEVVFSDDGMNHFRGGAYNCGDSEMLHECHYEAATWSPSAQGFRCCADPLSE